MTHEFMYSLSGYRNMVRMSSFKYILVEGPSDKRFLMYLIREIFGPRNDIKIHSAHQIQANTPMGNREKVEDICEKIGKWKYAQRFVGFVDREFREFDTENGIKDLIGKSKVIGRLIWSRGHSVENYFFNFTTLSRSLRDHSVTLYFDEALNLFKENIEQILKEACAIGLAAWKCNLLTPVRRSITNWNLIEFSTLGLTINTAKWIDFLVTKQKIKQEVALTLIDDFQKWSLIVSKTDFNTIKWLCDGHTGMAFIWAAFARCVFEVCQNSGSGDPRREAINVLRADEMVRCNGCASEWAFQATKKACEYPVDIFVLLGIAE